MSVPNVGRTHYRDGGTRGGRDQFNWEDVKTETYRENYIGHSLKAPVGLHYKRKDHMWWTKGKDPSPLAQVKSQDEKKHERKSKKHKKHKKEKKKHKKSHKKKKRKHDSDDDSDSQKITQEMIEKTMLRNHDEELMAQALGLSTRSEAELSKPSLDQRDMKVLLARGNEDFERTDTDGERIKGLGAGASIKHNLVDPGLLKRGGEATHFLQGTVSSSPTPQTEVRAEKERPETKRKKHKTKKVSLF